MKRDAHFRAAPPRWNTTGISAALAWCVALLVGFSPFLICAHNCGPPQLTVEVGRRVTYRITAVIQEREKSHYKMAINSDPSIATVSPDNQDTFTFGEFIIQGQSPGTNRLVFEWSYQPNMAMGICVVEVIVVARSSSGTQTGANHDSSARQGDPVNLFTGELIVEEKPELFLGGPMPLWFGRGYVSGLKRDGLVRSSLGDNWSHNFDTRALRVNNDVDIVTHEGRLIRFQKNGTVWQLIDNKTVPFQLADSGSDLVLGDPRDNRLYRFNAAGQLISIADGKGNVHTLTYNGNVLDQVTDGLGRTLWFTYQEFHNLATVTDGTRTISFEVFNNILARAVDAAGKATSYSYDFFRPDAALLLAKRLPRGNQPWTQVYDAAEKVSSQADGLSNKVGFAYQPGVATTTDPLGNPQVYKHNEAGQLVSVTDENSKTIQIDYDASGRRSAITDREGAITRYTFHDPSGKPATSVQADGTVTRFEYSSRTVEGIVFYDLAGITHPDRTTERFTYDAGGNVLTRTNQLGKVWRYTYNNHGQELTSISPSGAVTTYTYNADGTPATIKDHATNVTSLSYDPLKRLEREVHADGTARSYVHDARDHIVKMTNELGGVSTFTYDDNGNLTSEVGPSGNPTTYNYDPMDRISQMTDARLKSTSFSYDEVGRLSAMTDRSGGTTTINYDPTGKQTALIDPAGNSWKRSYDAEGTPVSTSDPLADTHTFGADVLGRINRTTTPAGNTYRVSHDSLGRVTGTLQPNGDAMQRRFDARGHLISAANPAATITAAYRRDDQGEIIEVTDPNGQLWKYGIDAQGRTTSVTDPLGNNRSYAYDGRNRIAQVTLPGGLGTLNLSYDGLNSIVRRQYSDGIDLAYAFDLDGNLMACPGIVLARDENGAIKDCNGLTFIRNEVEKVATLSLAPGKTIAYTYNTFGLIQQVTDWLGTITTFTYDAAGRLKTITRTNGVNTVYSYDGESRIVGITEGSIAIVNLARDANGRVSAVQRNLPTSPVVVPGTTDHVYDAAARKQGFQYDAMGRLTNDGARSYAWDLASRLKNYTQSGKTVSFTYDAVGNRMSRTDAAITRSYVWNYGLGMAVISVEREGTNDVRYYVHTPGGNLIYSIDAKDGRRLFYHYDEIGNTLFLTGDSGAVIASYSYGPYGELLAANGTVENLFTWQGKYGVQRESDTGFYYMRARYYDSATCRFLTRDPVTTTLPNALNPYQYAMGDPLRFVDPLGLQATGPAGNGIELRNNVVGSQREAARAKPDSQVRDPQTDAAASTPSQPIVYLTQAEWTYHTRRVKYLVRKRTAEAEWGWLDPGVPMGLDSPLLRRQRENFFFRGRVMNGGELNYYFQGMFWREFGISKEAMIAVIYWYKQWKYKRNPSSNDTFAACQGYRDTGDFLVEFRAEAFGNVEELNTTPQGIMETLNESGVRFPFVTTPAAQATAPGVSYSDD